MIRHKIFRAKTVGTLESQDASVDDVGKDDGEEERDDGGPPRVDDLTNLKIKKSSEI